MILTTEETYFNLLEELDSTMGSHLQRWTGPFRGHWTQFLDAADPSGNCSSFLDLAVFYGLHLYVHAWILRYQARHPGDANLIYNYFRKDLSNPDRYIRNVTLLDMAISVDYPSPETAQILLEFCANPNERSGYKPVPLWEHILDRAEASSRSIAIGKKWLQIMNVFMHYDVRKLQR